VQTSALTACANCGAALSGPYCAQCGQSAADLNRSVWALLVESWHEVVGVEGRLPSSLRLLGSRPGQLTTEYIAGRRARYTSPVRLYLVTSAAYFIVFRLTRGVDQRYYGLVDGIASSYYDALATTFILLLPALAIVLWLLHAGSRRASIYHLVFALHTGAAGLIWALVLTLITFGFKLVWQHHTRAPSWLPDFAFWLYAPGLVLFAGYVMLALRRTYDSGSAASAIRAMLVLASVVAALFLLTPVLLNLLAFA